MVGVGVIGYLWIPKLGHLQCPQDRREWAKKANAHCGDEEGGTDKAGMDREP